MNDTQVPVLYKKYQEVMHIILFILLALQYELVLVQVLRILHT